MKNIGLIRNIARQVTRGYIRLDTKIPDFTVVNPNGGQAYGQTLKSVDGGASGSTYTTTNYDGGTA